MNKKVYGLLAVVTCLGVLFTKNLFPKGDRPDVTIVGHIKMADGIGRQTAELANVLSEDFSVSIIARHLEEKDVPPKVLSLLHQKKQPLGTFRIFEETIGKTIPKSFRHNRHNHINIAYSMLEYTRIPSSWPPLLNKYFDAVAVPDQFLVEAYKRSGVKIPVFELPLGLDLTPFLKQSLKEGKNPVMVFANLSTVIERKNQITLVRAFAKAFGNSPKVRLLLNARGTEKEVNEKLKEEIEKLSCDNIVYTNNSLSNEEYLELFKSIDCYVSLSKGEGFSIQPREAMALGIPAIVTNNTAQTTICNSSLVKSVEASIAEPAYYKAKKKVRTGECFACKIEDAADAMLDVYHNYEKHLEKGFAAREWSRQYDFAKGDLAPLYRGLIAPKKIVLGTKNILHADYLETDSKALYEKYKRLAKPPQA